MHLARPGCFRPAVVGAVILGARPAGRRPPGPEDGGRDDGHAAGKQARQGIHPIVIPGMSSARPFRTTCRNLPLLTPIPRGS